MYPARSVLLKAVGLAILLASSLSLPARADDYGDASQLLRANKFAEAMSKVDGFLASKPGDPQMRFLKGVIQRNQGKTAEATSTFIKLTEDYPELPEPYNNLAVLYAGQGLYDKARVALEMAIRTNPSYATAHENMGDVFARLASQAYNKALQLDSSNTVVPPKLALIREVFKPNLSNQRPSASAPALSVQAPSVKPLAALAKTSAAATKPLAAAAKPAPVASAALPASSPSNPVRAPATEQSAIEALVQNWAKAWSERDMPKYLAAYSADFTPPGSQSRAAWVKERTARITGKSHINVKVNELSITISGDQASAKFRQIYKANALSVSSRKTLSLHKVNAQWLIHKESTGH